MEPYGIPDDRHDYPYGDSMSRDLDLPDDRRRGRNDRSRPRTRWGRDEPPPPGRRVRSRSREREQHWEPYDDYDDYDDRDGRDRRDRYRDRGRDDRYRDRDDRFSPMDRDRDDRFPPLDRDGDDRFPPPDRDRDDRFPPPERERGPRERRDRDKGRDRRRRPSDRYERDGDYRSHDYDYDDGDSYRSERDRAGSETPTNLVMMRGLPYSAIEDDISAELQQKGLAYKDIKIIKDKQGESRGFGFVEFSDVKIAERWLYLTQGTLIVQDRTVHLEYGKPRPAEQDWACSKCGTLNYASRRRTSCFSCGAAKEDAAEDPYNYEDYYNDSYYDDDGLSSSGGTSGSHKDRDAPASAPPCNILIMRGLDVNTSEETVRNSIVQVSGIQIYDVRLIKDKITGVSRGFCFIELGSTEDATKLLDGIQDMDPPYTIENKKVLVGYARNTLHPPPSKPKSNESKPARQRSATHAGNTKIANTAIAQAQAAQAQGFYDQQSSGQNQQFAQGTPASQQTTGQAVSQASHTGQGYEQTLNGQQGQTTAQQYQQYQQYYQQQQSEVQGQQQQQQGQMFHQLYDISSFTYDQSTGYYYDPNSGLYYDLNTGYHYNGNTGQFLYWDANQQQYFVVNQDGSLSAPAAAGTTAATAQEQAVDDKDKVQHKPSGPSARKIAKDMERWAKKMNEATAIKQIAMRQAFLELKAQEAREEALRKQMEDEGVFKKPQLPTTAVPPVKKVKSLFTLDEEAESPLLGGTQKPTKQSLVAEYGGDDSDEESDLDSKFIDVNKLACLLCQRKFANKETLIKHQQMSDLHKQNLEKLKKKV